MTDASRQPQADLGHPCWFIVGPTAIGKSAVALCIAERLGGEIVSVDSMQVYRGMDVGTAKPSSSERVRVPHHLIDVVDLNEAFDAAQFRDHAIHATRGIRERRRPPIFCGGTGLYFRALLEGLGTAPPSDPAVRRELEILPLEVLLEELQRHDPETFGRIDRRNRRRVIRAVEVIRLTGRSFAGQRSAWERSPRPGCPPLLGLARSPEDLRARIEDRVEAMFRGGLVEETAVLLQRGLSENATAMQALGYRQVVEHLRGIRGLPETIALVKTRTWQFARRQMTWFRRQLPVQWLEVAPGESVEGIADRLLALHSRAG